MLLSARVLAAVSNVDHALLLSALESLSFSTVRPSEDVTALTHALIEAMHIVDALDVSVERAGAPDGACDSSSDDSAATSRACSVALCRLIGRVARARTRTAAVAAASATAWSFVRRTLSLVKEDRKGCAETLETLMALLAEHGATMPQREATLLLCVLVKDQVDTHAYENTSQTVVGTEQRLRAQALSNLVTRATAALSGEDLECAADWAIHSLQQAACAMRKIKSRLTQGQPQRGGKQAGAVQSLLAPSATASLLAAHLRAVQMIVQEAPTACLPRHADVLAATLAALYTFDCECTTIEATSTVASDCADERNMAYRPPAKVSEGGAKYKPPHLRARMQSPSAGEGSEGRFNEFSSDSEVGHSDGEGTPRARRHTPGSKVRVAAAQLTQAIARADPRVLHAHWPVILLAGARSGRRATKGLLGALLADVHPRVRRSAASALGVILDGASKNYIAAAMWRPSRHPAAFTPLSETIGIIVSACHEVLRKVVRCEPDDAVSLAALKTFAIAASNTDFTRLDPALLPNDLRALLARLDQLSMEPGTATEEMLSSTLTCVSVLAAAKVPPAAAAAVGRVFAGSREDQAEHRDCLLARLFDLSTSRAHRPEALTALRAVAVHHPHLLHARWGDLLDVCRMHAHAREYKCHALLLRIIYDLLLALSSHGCACGARGLHVHVNAVRLRALWDEVLEKVVPDWLASPSPAVRSAGIHLFSALGGSAMCVLPPGTALWCIGFIVEGVRDGNCEVVAAAARTAGVVASYIPPGECARGLPVIARTLIEALGCAPSASIAAVAWGVAQLSARLCLLAQGVRSSNRPLPRPPRRWSSAGPSLLGVSLEMFAAHVLEIGRARERALSHVATALGNLIGISTPRSAWMDDAVAWLVECCSTDSFHTRVHAAVCAALEEALAWCPATEPRVLGWEVAAVPALLRLLAKTSSVRVQLNAARALLANVDGLRRVGALQQVSSAVLSASELNDNDRNHSYVQAAAAALVMKT